MIFMDPYSCKDIRVSIEWIDTTVFCLDTLFQAGLDRDSTDARASVVFRFNWANQKALFLFLIALNWWVRNNLNLTFFSRHNTLLTNDTVCCTKVSQKKGRAEASKSHMQNRLSRIPTENTVEIFHCKSIGPTSLTMGNPTSLTMNKQSITTN